MPSAEMTDDFLTVIRKPHRLRVSRLFTNEAITAIRRARKEPVPPRDVVALFVASVVIGIVIGMHLRGLW